MVFEQDNKCLFGESYAVGLAEQSKTNPLEEIQNACNMCFELDALNITLNRQLSGRMEGVNAAMLYQIRISNNDPQLLAKWAT